jgi:hypothetical protein
VILKLKERSGSSLPAIKKALRASKDQFRFINAALKSGVKKGTFVQNKGKYKVSAEAKKKPKKKAVKKKKKVVKKKKKKVKKKKKKRLCVQTDGCDKKKPPILKKNETTSESSVEKFLKGEDTKVKTKSENSDDENAGAKVFRFFVAVTVGIFVIAVFTFRFNFCIFAFQKLLHAGFGRSFVLFQDWRLFLVASIRLNAQSLLLLLLDLLLLLLHHFLLLFDRLLLGFFLGLRRHLVLALVLDKGSLLHSALEGSVDEAELILRGTKGLLDGRKRGSTSLLELEDHVLDLVLWCGVLTDGRG